MACALAAEYKPKEENYQDAMQKPTFLAPCRQVAWIVWDRPKKHARVLLARSLNASASLPLTRVPPERSPDAGDWVGYRPMSDPLPKCQLFTSG